MPAPEGVQPTATGALGRTPLINLLVYMADKTLTGSVVFTTPSGAESIIHSLKGAPAKVRVADAVHHLGRVLLEIGLLDDQGLTASLATLAESGGLHGELLLRTGRLDKAGLVAGLRAQLQRKITHLFDAPPATEYAFYADKNLLDGYGGPELTPVDPMRVIVSAVRARPNDPLIDATLARFGGLPVRLHEEANVQLFGFNPGEQAVVELIRVAPGPLQTLEAAEVAPPRVLRMVVYTLAITRHLDFGVAGVRPVGVARLEEGAAAVARVKLKPRSALPSAQPKTGLELDEALSERRNKIIDRADAIEREDYFTMLGVKRDATPGDLQKAYFALAKTWHTDRIPQELSDVRDRAAKVFARINEAFETLSNPQRKARYLEILERGDQEAEAAVVQRILDAANDYQKADVYLKKRDLANAEKFAKKAFDADPGDPDYAAMWAQVQLTKRGENDPVMDLIEMLNLALQRRDNSERALTVRALCLKREGEFDAALDDYKAVLKINPRNIEAEREVRLFEMRKASGNLKKPSKGGGGDDGGAFGGIGKLFKR